MNEYFSVWPHKQQANLCVYMRLYYKSSKPTDCDGGCL